MGSLSQTKPKPSEAVLLLNPTSSPVPSVFIFTQSLRGQHYFDDGDGDDDDDDADADDIYIVMNCVCVCLSRKMITFFKGLSVSFGFSLVSMFFPWFFKVV